MCCATSMSIWLLYVVFWGQLSTRLFLFKNQILVNFRIFDIISEILRMISYYSFTWEYKEEKLYIICTYFKNILNLRCEYHDINFNSEFPHVAPCKSRRVWGWQPPLTQPSFIAISWAGASGRISALCSYWPRKWPLDWNSICVLQSQPCTSYALHNHLWAIYILQSQLYTSYALCNYVWAICVLQSQSNTRYLISNSYQPDSPISTSYNTLFQYFLRFIIVLLDSFFQYSFLIMLNVNYRNLFFIYRKHIHKYFNSIKF